MNGKMRLFSMSKFYRGKIFVGLGAVFILALVLHGCSVSRVAKDTWKSLVEKDAPVFDKRFKEVSSQDINLQNFWTEGVPVEDRKPVPLNNMTFAEVADSVKGGVVNIYTQRIEERDATFGIAPNDLLPFRIPIVSTILDIVPFQVPIPFNTEGVSLGSGFIINPEGYILTNAHVVFNATDINVVLEGGKLNFPAKIIGLDRMTDVALLKMESDLPLTALPLGNSDELRMGEMVIAMGNPLGLQHSVTSGLVSAKDRYAPQLSDQFIDFIQTDSAINPGSSGGPLLNLYGEVVGVNTAIIQQAQLIGFAVPVNTVKEVMRMLIVGQTERGWFGAQARPLTVQNAVELGYEGEEGVVVTKVEAGGPAEQAGVQPNDIVFELYGKQFAGFSGFRRKLLGLMPGQEINLTIFRGGETIAITSILGKKNVEDE